ncbi:hypothetical protein RhiirC2_783846 [Rhizophagus irregularis]|uniref:Uncharacterized protein n=1 Tax=Rhizophagus irregularis TaxID=588596 RepID=A0A2N1MZY6_9GLOM|nr:hypothetical protein RhiirC2_783846 [Rhizophagus irregularis]
MVDHEIADVNQMIEELNTTTNSHITLLVNVLKDFFSNLKEKIPIENILNDNDIINIVCKEIYKDENNDDDDFKKELILILLNDAWEIQIRAIDIAHRKCEMNLQIIRVEELIFQKYQPSKITRYTAQYKQI